MTYLHVSHFITGERMQSVLCVETHNLLVKITYLCVPVAKLKQRNLPIKPQNPTQLLRHKTGLEGRGEILLENSFRR